MDELWRRAGWSEEQEQAHAEAWALRILTCPRRACRRHRTCTAGLRGRCPALEAHPIPKDTQESLLLLVRLQLERRRAELAAGEAIAAAAAAAWREASREADARRHALAFRRAREARGRGDARERARGREVQLTRPLPRSSY